MIFLTAIRVMAGALLVMVLSGYAWSLACFPRGSRGALERLVYSVALSISTLSIAFFFANRFLAVGINMVSSSLILALVTLLGFIHALFRKRGVYGRVGISRLIGRRPAPGQDSGEG